jgi:SPP1 family predicted phage head-tail adaptor
MRKRIQIQTRTDAEYGDYSGDITRATVATVWAQVINVTGTAQVDSRNAGEGITHQFRIRYRTDVTKKNEIVYDGKRYEIITIQVGKDERDRFLIIEANERDVVGTLDNPSPES